MPESSPWWEWRSGVVVLSGEPLRVDVDAPGNFGLFLVIAHKAWVGRDFEISVLSDGRAMIVIQPDEVRLRGDTLGRAIAAAILAAPCPRINAGESEFN